MDTVGLRVSALAAAVVEDFEPTGWAHLKDLGTGHRVLLTAEEDAGAGSPDETGTTEATDTADGAATAGGTAEGTAATDTADTPSPTDPSPGHRRLVATVCTDPATALSLRAAAEASRVLDTMNRPVSVDRPHFVAFHEVAAGDLGPDSPPATVVFTTPLPGAPVGNLLATRRELVSSLAGVLAELHSCDPGPIAGAGLVVLEAEALRDELLDRLDRGAATGLVPAELLNRWETAAENVALWHFLSTPVHGGVAESTVYSDGSRIVGLTGWSSLRVSDPAIDVAAVTSLLDPADIDVLYDAYAEKRPAADPALRERAELRAEFAVLDWLLAATASGDEADVADATELLDSLAAVVTTSSEVAAEVSATEARIHDAGHTRTEEDTAAGRGENSEPPAQTKSSEDDEESTGTESESSGAHTEPPAEPADAGEPANAGETAGSSESADSDEPEEPTEAQEPTDEAPTAGDSPDTEGPPTVPILRRE